MEHGICLSVRIRIGEQPSPEEPWTKNNESLAGLGSRTVAMATVPVVLSAPQPGNAVEHGGTVRGFAHGLAFQTEAFCVICT